MSMPSFSETEHPDYELMAEAGRIAADTHELLASMIEPGRTTDELNRKAEEFIRSQGAEPAFYDFNDSSDAITVSINHELIHAPPNSEKRIQAGDIVSIDLGAKYDGHYSDTAVTHIANETKKSEHEELLEHAKSTLYAGILKAIAGNTLRDIGEAIEEKSGPFGNVTGWAGHFIGCELHLEPKVHNTAEQNDPVLLERGMYLAIEPVLTLAASDQTYQRSPGGAVLTRSGKPGAHFEHTIRVGKDRAELLTSRSDEPDTL